MSAVTAATVSAGLGVYSAVSGAYDSSKAKKLRSQQAEDILGQLDAEKLIYEDELDMIQKQTTLAESKLKMQSGQQVEDLGEQVGVALNKLVGTSKYGGGASERSMIDVESKYDETMGDLKETYDMSMDELALREEESERSAFLRHEEIMGGLQAQREELLAML